MEWSILNIKSCESELKLIIQFNKKKWPNKLVNLMFNYLGYSKYQNFKAITSKYR